MAPVQHTVFFKFPDLQPPDSLKLSRKESTDLGVEPEPPKSEAVARWGKLRTAVQAASAFVSMDKRAQALYDVVEKFNSLSGISAQFWAYGVGVERMLTGEGPTASKEQFMAEVDWPDKTDGYTHCLLVVARDTASLKTYLHSDFHLKEWMPAVKPYIKGIVVFDNELVPSLENVKKATIQHPVLFKLPDVAGTVPPELDDIITKFNTLPGITAGFRPYGATGLDKEALMAEVDWPDKSDGYTHCLWVLAEDSRALKTYLHSDYHKKEWIPAVGKYFKGILVFDTILFTDQMGTAFPKPSSGVNMLLVASFLILAVGVLVAALANPTVFTAKFKGV